MYQLKLGSREHVLGSGTVLLLITFFCLAFRDLGTLEQLKVERIIAVIYPLYYCYDFYLKRKHLKWEWIRFVPFEICNLLVFFYSYAYWTQNQFALNLCLLWTLSLTFQSLLTPTPARAFPHPEFIRYFFAHGFLVANAFYILVVKKTSLTLANTLQSFFVLQGFMLIAFIANFIFNQNFMLLRHLPAQKTILNYFGKWPIYILGMNGAALLAHLFLYWIFS